MSSTPENVYISDPVKISAEPIEKEIEDDRNVEEIKQHEYDCCDEGKESGESPENYFIGLCSSFRASKLISVLVIGLLVLLLLLYIVFLPVAVVVLLQGQHELHKIVYDLEKKVELSNSSNVPTREVIIEKNYTVSEPVIVSVSNISSDRLDSLNATVLALGESIIAQGEAILTMQGYQTDLGIAHNSTTSRMERLEQEIKYNNSLLTSQWNETVQQLDNLSALVDMFSQSHTDHQLQINGIQNKVSAIESKQAQMVNQLTSLESGHQSQAQEISSLRSDTSQLTNQLTDTKRQVTDNQGKISKAEDSIRSLQSGMTRAQQDLIDVKQRTSKLESFHSGTNHASSKYSIYFTLLMFVFLAILFT